MTGFGISVSRAWTEVGRKNVDDMLSLGYEKHKGVVIDGPSCSSLG